MKKDLSLPLLAFTILAIFLLLSLVSCRSYYAGYGKGQAKHRKCGQRNTNSRIFGAIPADTEAFNLKVKGGKSLKDLGWEIKDLLYSVEVCNAEIGVVF